MKLVLTSGRPDAEFPQVARRCVCHIAPFDTIDRPDQSRIGWIRSQCRLCGAFLGYRMAPTNSERDKNQPERN